MGAWRSVLVLLVVSVMSLAACSGTDDSGDSATGSDGGDAATAPEQLGESLDDAEVGSTALPSVGPSVIKNARTDLEVERDGLTDSLRSATQIAEERGGFVFASSMGGEDQRSASVKLRIPSEEFEGALAELQGLGKVVDQEVSRVDVSEEFIDLDARLRNLRAQEDVILDLMTQAVSIEQTIQIQRELAPIQLEMERIRGRIRFLQDRTSLGTIVLNFQEEGVVIAQEGRLEKALDQAVDGTLAVMAGAFVAAGYVIPLSVLALMLVLIGRIVYRLAPRLPFQ